MNGTSIQPKAIQRLDYKPSAFLIKTIHLNVDIEADYTHVTSDMLVVRNPAVSDAVTTLALDGFNLTLLSIELNGKPLNPSRYVATPTALHIHEISETFDTFQLKITTQIYPQNNTQLSGLYQSKSMYCTQCEAQGFRAITYYLDRPDVLAKFTTTIEANKDKYPLLLSNGNRIETVDLGERHRVTWDDPFPKPCYLFALVAGDLDCLEDSFKTQSGRDVKLEIYVEKGKRDSAGHAMVSLKKAMRWDEAIYGLEYDLDIFMIVAVSDFNMGAMENKGLNIFNDQYILANPQTATDADYINIESVVAHEYFHNWTGNRVTCRDWFQLSLKEGLTVFRDQEFSCDMNSRDVIRINEVNILRTAQFAEDAGPMAHPVRPHSYIEINNFYTATVYNKGAEVIRMMHLLLGKENYRAGMDLYFQRHDGQAVTTDDFAAAMIDASGVELSQFKYWYDFAGTPKVVVRSHYDETARTITLNFTQTIPDTPGQQNKPAFHIPIRLGLIDIDGNEIKLITEDSRIINSVYSLKEKESVITFSGLTKRVIPSLLRGFSAPVIMEVDYSDEDLALLFVHDTDGFARYEAGQQLLTRAIISIYESMLHSDKSTVSDTVLRAYKAIVNAEIMDKSLHAQLLILPSLAYVKSFIQEVNISVLYQAHRFVQEALVRDNQQQFEFIYHEFRNPDCEISQANMSYRKLQNTALCSLTVLAEDKYLEWAFEQFSNDLSMTNSIAALSALNDTNSIWREKALSEFFNQWQGEELVLNKWFALQASSALPTTLETVKSLLNHPNFTYKNPNRARALIYSFCSLNHVCFHDVMGEGYAFLVEQIRIINGLNPQLAARIVSPLTQWRSYDLHQQSLMKQALNDIRGISQLSNDVFEIVEKSLAGAH